MGWHLTQDRKYLDALEKAGQWLIRAQLPGKARGWAEQYGDDGKRTRPRSLATPTTTSDSSTPRETGSRLRCCTPSRSGRPPRPGRRQPPRWPRLVLCRQRLTFSQKGNPFLTFALKAAVAGWRRAGTPWPCAWHHSRPALANIFRTSSSDF